jgi:hypothetical protein
MTVLSPSHAEPPPGSVRACACVPRQPSQLRPWRRRIELKEDIRKRLGGDKADAVILAWHGRAHAACRRIMHRSPRSTPRFADPLAEFR